MDVRTAVKVPVQRAFAALGYQVRKLDPPPADAPPDGGVTGRALPLWDDDAPFQALRREMEGHTLVGPSDAYLLYRFAEHVRGLDGDVAEVGVYRGGTGRLLAKVLEPAGKLVHLFDTFTGLPAADPTRDLHREGDFGDTSFEAVRAYLADCPNARLYPGFFPDTAGPVEDRAFCLVHVDVDIYPSVLACCRFFYPRLVRGGVLVFDDYGRQSCPGAREAVDEFFADKPEQAVYLPSAQAFAVKL